MIPASNDSIFESIAINLIAEYYGWNESSLAELHESQDDMLEQMRLGYPQSGSTDHWTVHGLFQVFELFLKRQLVRTRPNPFWTLPTAYNSSCKWIWYGKENLEFK